MVYVLSSIQVFCVSERTMAGDCVCPYNGEINIRGDTMRGLFILFALVFALVTGATANVVATTLQSQMSTSGDGW
jgi:hypothetical protein